MLVAVEGGRSGARRGVAEVSTGPAVWLLASRLLGRPVPVDEPYPHVEGCHIGTEHDGVTPITMYRNGCARCAQEGYRPRADRARH